MRLRNAIVALSLSFISSSLCAEVVLQDNFNDGIVDPRYSSINGALIFESGGQMIVLMFSPDSGVNIDTSDLPGLACTRLKYEVEEGTFPVGGILQFELLADSSFPPGLEFAPVTVALTRPFWNRCQYHMKQADGSTTTVGFWKSTHQGEACPEMKDLRIDLLAKEDVTCPDGSVVENAQRIQVELRNGQPLTETKDGKEIDIIRAEGCQYHASITPFTGADAIKSLEITSQSELPGLPPPAGQGGIAGFGPITFKLDSITIDDEHPDPSVPVVTVEPSQLVPGQKAQVLVSTVAPILLPGVTTINMGPDILIQNVQILDPHQALVMVQVDERARNTGHDVTVTTCDVLHMSEIIILPLDPTVPLPPNQPPTLNVVNPGSVPAGIPFQVDTTWDDPDDQFILGLLAVINMATMQEIFDTDFFFLDTSGNAPVPQAVFLAGLPQGQYKIVGVASDGLADDVVQEIFFIVEGQAPPTSPCEADFNGDGVVDGADLGQLLLAFGKGCEDCEFVVPPD